MFKKFQVILFFIFVSMGMLVSASAETWKVVRVTQPAEISGNGRNWEPLRKGMVLGPKVWIKTGVRGRAMLRRNKETILYRANTQARIIQNNRSGRKTELKQTSGRLLLDVETRKYKHTKVTTPYLAVVVKGTKFEVFVGSGSSGVKVRRGLVEVTDTRRNERVRVAKGQSVALDVRKNQKMHLRGRGKKAPIINLRTGRPVASINSTQNRNRSAVSNGVGQNKTNNGTSNGNANGSSNGNANGSSNGNGNGSSNGNGNGSSNGNGNGSSNGNGNGSSNGNGNGSSNGNGNGKS